MKTTTTLAVMILTCAVACAGERFVSTIGTVEKEIPADRLDMTVVVQASEKTIPESIASLDRLLEDFGKQMSAWGFPATAVSLKERQTKRPGLYRPETGADGLLLHATLTVRLLSLTNYDKLLTYIGTRQEFETASFQTLES